MDNTENQDFNQEENEGIEEFAPKEPKSKLPIFIGIAAVLAIVLLFFFIQNRNLKEEVTASQENLNEAILQLDSIEGQLDMKILEIQKLGGEIDDLLVVKSELEAEKKKLLTSNSANRSTIASLRDKVSGYEELLVIKDQEIAQLKEQNEVLLTENSVLKTEKNQLSETITDITKNRDELTEQVAVASQLKVSGMKIFAVNSRGKERETEFKNRHIEQIKVEFTVDENRVAPIEGKDLLIRVVAPDNNVLFDVTRGSGSFNYEGREMFYTAKKEILFDRSSQKVSLLYDKGSEYALGKHTVEVYTDDYLMGKGTFVVK